MCFNARLAADFETFGFDKHEIRFPESSRASWSAIRFEVERTG
jgi:hypothetical protein